MDTNIKKIVEELELKRSELISEASNIDEALAALKKINGYLSPTIKAAVVRRVRGAERYTVEELDKRDFAIDYIRNKGKEAAASELFKEYMKKIGRDDILRLLTNNKNYRKEYNRFYQALAGPKGRRMGLTHKTYKNLQGAQGGKEAYFNVNSALLLQYEQTVQNPDKTVTEVK